MPAERTKRWSHTGADVCYSQIVWQAPVASLFIDSSPKVAEINDSDLPPLVDAPPIPCPPPSSQFIMYPPPTFDSSDSIPSSQSTWSLVSDEEESQGDRSRGKGSTSHSKKKPENHIPRPPNAFILFRSSFIKSQRVSQSVETNHSTLSKICGLTWKNLPESERKQWHDVAKKERETHRRKFPEYAFRPQQSKTKGSGGGTAGCGGGTGKRKVREVEPKDEERCAQIAELLGRGLKGEELNAKMEEYDRTHVQQIVTRFEAPITEKSFRRGSSAPIEATELTIEQALFLPREKTTAKVRQSVSERRTRTLTLPEPKFETHSNINFANFSFDSTLPSMPSPPIDPSRLPSNASTTFSQDVPFDLDNAFVQMSDWASTCSSPISPSTMNDFLSTPSPPPFDFGASTPGFDLSTPPTPNFDLPLSVSVNAEIFNTQANFDSGPLKNFDFNAFSIPPTYQQNVVDEFATDAFIGMDAGLGSFDLGVGDYSSTFDVVPLYGL